MAMRSIGLRCHAVLRRPALLSAHARSFATKKAKFPVHQVGPVLTQQELVQRLATTGEPLFKRTRYPASKVYRMEEYKTIIENPDLKFMLCLQNSISPAAWSAFRAQIEHSCPDIKFKSIKNSLFRIGALHGTKYEPLESLFVGPTSLLYHTNEETFWKDWLTLHKALNKNKKNPIKVVVLGGIFDGEITTFTMLNRITTIPSPLHVRSQLCDVLLKPAHEIVRVLQSPTNNLVKVLDFKAKAENGAESP